MGRVVLVTGVSRYLGGRFARRIAADPASTGSSASTSSRLRATSAGRLRARRHPQPRDRQGARRRGRRHRRPHQRASGGQPRAGGRSSMKENNVIGTMQLLAACQRGARARAPGRASSATVYGPRAATPPCSPRTWTPAAAALGLRQGHRSRSRATSAASPAADPTSRSPCCASPTHLVGHHEDSPLTEYFRLPVVPTAVRATTRGCSSSTRTTRSSVLLHATVDGVHGIFNVAGDGVMMLSQALRRIGRPTVPLPGFAARQRRVGPQAGRDRRLSSRAARRLPHLTAAASTPPGCASMLGFNPAYTTEAAFADFARSVDPGLVPRPAPAGADVTTGAARG